MLNMFKNRRRGGGRSRDKLNMFNIGGNAGSGSRNAKKKPSVLAEGPIS
jgi:hypothetical protein